MGRTGWFVLGAVVAGLSACEGCGGPGGESSGLPGSNGLPGLTTSSSSTSGTPMDPVMALEVEPQSFNLNLVWGAPQHRALRAVLVRQSGARETVMAAWSSDAPAIASINQDGRALFTAQRAGVVNLTATAQGLTAVSRAVVELTAQRVLPGADPGAPVDFASATCIPGGRATPTLLYPLNGVIMPLNVPSPVIQWSGEDVQVHRLTLAGSAATVVLYVAGAAREATVPQDLWNVLVNAHAGSQLRITVDALLDRAACGTSATQVLKLASADLSSTVYYWAVSLGQIVRLDVGATRGQRLNIEPANDQGNRCNACHVLSRDGDKLAFTYYEGSGPGGVVNVSTPQTPLFTPSYDTRWNFAAFDNTGRLLLTNWQKTFTLRNADTGAPLSAVNVTDAAHPAWSPDGATVAFAGNIRVGANPANWEVDFTNSDLMVMDFNVGTQQFGAPAVRVPGNGRAVAYPSFSPDSRYVVYQYGPDARSRQSEGSAIYNADLMLASVTGGDAVQLTVMNPDHNSYMPTFSPFVEGGYRWVAFYSRRPYGHRVSDPYRPQIWVAALDVDAPNGVDPSHPPFWLPGQDEATSNFSSFFARSPCRETNGICTTDAQCCNGALCRPSADGAQRCSPPENACSLAGETCQGNGDCCPGSGQCRINGETGLGICSTGGEACRMQNESCMADGDCCAGAGACLPGTGGILLCQPPTMCKREGDGCVKDEDCCPGAGFCIQSVCAVPGG